MLTEPHGDLIDAIFAHFRHNEMNYYINTHDQRESKYPIDHSENIEESNSISEIDSRHSIDFTITNSNLQKLNTKDDDINNRNRSLNTKQRNIFDYVHKWTRDYAINQLCKFSKQMKR